MNAVKERILGAVSIMSDPDAESLWEYILSKFQTRAAWEDIEEEEPDEIDLMMLKEIEEDPDCHKFVSAEEAMRELGM